MSKYLSVSEREYNKNTLRELLTVAHVDALDNFTRPPLHIVQAHVTGYENRVAEILHSMPFVDCLQALTQIICGHDAYTPQFYQFLRNYEQTHPNRCPVTTLAGAKRRFRRSVYVGNNYEFQHMFLEFWEQRCQVCELMVLLLEILDERNIQINH